MMKVKLLCGMFLAGVAVGVWYVSKYLFPDYREPEGWLAEGVFQSADGRQYSWTGAISEVGNAELEPVYDGDVPFGFMKNPDVAVNHMRNFNTNYFGPEKRI